MDNQYAWRRHRENSCCEQFGRLHHHLHRHHHEFLRSHRVFRYARPVVFLLNLIILVLLFRWAGIKAIGIFFAVVLVVKEIAMFVFLKRLEKRIIEPIQELQRGVEEIAKGNFDVRVECDLPTDVGLLTVSFNEMAYQLLQGEQVKAEYEENRKGLVANISHDLKTPITSIRGYVEMLLEGEASPEQRERYLKTIHHNISYLNHLVDDLFLFSKLDMQKLELKLEEVPVRSYFADLMEEYRLELEPRQVGLKFVDLLDEERLVRMDGKRVYQAINNIVRNAIGHGPEQGLSLEVTLYRRGDWIAVDIADNGPGIPQDKLPLIFDRFYRIDTERRKQFESTGLGLAITRELVQAHGGEIAVTSSVGEGTCFTVMLPQSEESR
ncbi:HAMP domain-containing sensor histidine kinase [Geomonas oryzae]|uniref:HAMP domain-containing sensor histidine kinase n=1 Tax=Geomonas oryzae TaxID=2364273 RepID=UPI00100B6F20|nr:HAMP domain-containing sensor histidine kinase [Geomonas oryzae]